MHRILYEKIVGAKVMRGNMRGHLTFYEQMMMQVPGKKDNIDEEKMCTGCQYHRKDFAYRYCLHTECPYVKGHKTFRKEAYEMPGQMCICLMTVP